MGKFAIKHLLKEIAKDMNCKTVFDAIEGLIKDFDYDIQAYQRDIFPLTYVIVYKFSALNTIRLVISKKDGLVTYKLSLFCNYNDLTLEDNNFKELCEEHIGNRVEILTFLKEKGSFFVETLENNKHYIYAVNYLLDYAVKKQMNSLHVGHLKHKYLYGAFLIYKDVWLSDTVGYKNMYCIQGYKDKLKIINSLVLQKSDGKLTKITENIVYDNSAFDLKAAWNAMKYVVLESADEKDLCKKYSLS